MLSYNGYLNTPDLDNFHEYRQMVISKPQPIIAPISPVPPIAASQPFVKVCQITSRKFPTSAIRKRYGAIRRSNNRAIAPKRLQRAMRSVRPWSKWVRLSKYACCAGFRPMMPTLMRSKESNVHPAEMKKKIEKAHIHKDRFLFLASVYFTIWPPKFLLTHKLNA
jgi:hypothetical protein